MADIVPITPEQQQILDVFDLVQNNKAAAKEALDFIGASQLNYQLFVKYYPQTVGQADNVSRALTTVSLAQDALSLFS